MEDTRRVENAVRALASEVLAKYEKKKKVDSVQELIILATYVNMKKLEELRNDVEGILRAFERLDSLVDVVKQLRAAVENLQKSQLEETLRLLREVNKKLEETLRGETYLVEEV